METKEKKDRVLGIGWVPLLLGFFIGGILYRILAGGTMGFVGGTVVGIISIFIFGIPIRMLIDKLKSNQKG